MQKMINTIKSNLGNSNDIVERKINNIAYIFLESVSSDDKISDFLNKSITKTNDINNLLTYLKNNIYNSHITILDNIDESYYYLSSGYTCLFIKNSKKYIAIETKLKLDRGVTESTSEPIIRGPKDSFTENHAFNIGRIRKRIKDKNLWNNEIKVGKYTQSKISIIYINNIVNKKNVDKIKSKLMKIDIDGILDSGYIRDFLQSEQK